MQKLRAAKQMEDDSFRNVMDMKANFGGFAAALQELNLPVWVMNVVPISGPSTLKLIYDRGFIGSYHDWYGLVLMTLRIAFRFQNDPCSRSLHFFICVDMVDVC